MSVFSVGTWQLSGPLTLDGHADGFPDVGREAAVRLIRECGDLGINAVDCAEIYGNGEGERRVGEALQGQRDRWVVTTKFGFRCGPNQQRITDASAETIRPSLEGSLKRLRTDYVDLLLYHCRPDATQVLKGQRELERLKQEGKLRAYGVSTDDPEVLSLLVSAGAQVVLFSQSILTHPKQLLQPAKARGLGVMIRGALASGRLSGKYFGRDPEFSHEDIRWSARGARWRYPIVDRFRPAGLSMPAFALRYLLDFDTTHTIVLGGKALDQYQIAVGALDAPRLSHSTHWELACLRAAFALEKTARRLAGAGARRLRRAVPRTR